MKKSKNKKCDRIKNFIKKGDYKKIKKSTYWVMIKNKNIYILKI